MKITRFQELVSVILLVIFSSTLTGFVVQHNAYGATVIDTIPVGVQPYGIAFDSTNGNIYVANNGGDTVSVINGATNTVISTIPVGSGPRNLAFDSTNGNIYVANQNDNTVSVINGATNTVISTIPGMSSPYGIAFDSANGNIYVANYGSNTVSVINGATNTVVGVPILVDVFPTGMAFDSTNGNIYVANNIGTVSVINGATNTVISTIPVGANPTWATFDSANGNIYVSNNAGDTVSVINGATNTVITTIAGFNGPTGMAFDSANGNIYVASLAVGSNNISIIDGSTNTIVGTPIPVGAGPEGVTFDSANGYIYVVNIVDGTVSVISDPVSSSSSSGGHSVWIHHPPSLGNDYYYKYPGGFTLNGKSFDITKYGITIPQQVLNLGQADNFTFKIYDERGGSTISHVGMYIHFKGDASVANADTSFVWDKHDGVQISDPDKSFTDVNVTRHYDGNFAYVSITFTPTKAMPDSSIIMRMWDDKLASMDVPINGAIIIVDPNAPVQVTKVPDNQYDDYATLVNLLDTDGYQMPSILHRVQSGSDLSPTVDVYWVYDRGTDKLTMVETYKDGTIIGDIVYNLVKRPVGPTITDHNYVYIPMQNNRQNPDQEKIVMQQEEAKATKIIESINIPIKKLS